MQFWPHESQSLPGSHSAGGHWRICRIAVEYTVLTLFISSKMALIVQSNIYKWYQQDFGHLTPPHTITPEQSWSPTMLSSLIPMTLSRHYTPQSSPQLSHLPTLAHHLLQTISKLVLYHSPAQLLPHLYSHSWYLHPTFPIMPIVPPQDSNN